ncbi:hypothetical protein BD410DRAFT_734472, partial [Rickenella mellea]
MASTIQTILDALEHVRCSPSQFFITLVTNPLYSNHPAVGQLLSRTEDILYALQNHPEGLRALDNWAEKTATKVYTRELVAITKQSSLHFSAKNATPEVLEHFRIESMAENMQATAPRLWRLVLCLLAADEELEHRRDARWRKKEGMESAVSKGGKGGGEDWDEEAEYWERDGESIVEGEEASERHCSARERRYALLRVRAVTVLNIFAKSTNQKCGGLAVIVGFFAHTCNTPAKVIETLAHAGISISTSAINDAVSSLSVKARLKLEELAQTLLGGVAYDNFDVAFHVSVPTIENGDSMLYHLTSGTMLRLEHGATVEGLKYSEYLWKQSRFYP